MVISFRFGLKDQSGSFQKIGSDLCTDNITVIIELNLNRHGLLNQWTFSSFVNYFTSIYLPNLELLLFLVVLALPNASIIGFVATNYTCKA